MSLSEAAQVADRLPAPWTLEEARAVGGRVRRVVLLKTLWYPEVLDGLEASARAYLERMGLGAEVVETRIVPGAFELPLAASWAVQGDEAADFVVALGCIVKGSTPHFDFVARAAVEGLLRVSLDSGRPVALGVLTVDDLPQALERKDKGLEAAQAAFFMHLGRLRRPEAKILNAASRPSQI